MFLIILLFLMIGIPIIAKRLVEKERLKVFTVLNFLFFIHGLFFLTISNSYISYKYDLIDITSIITFCLSIFYFLYLLHRYLIDKTFLILGLIGIEFFIIFLWFVLLVPDNTFGITEITRCSEIDNKYVVREINYNFGWLDGGTRFSLTKIQNNGIFEEFYNNVDLVSRYPMNYSIKIEGKAFIIRNQEKYDETHSFRVDTFYIQNSIINRLTIN